MSTGQADTGVLNANELLARSIAGSPVIDYTTGAVAIQKQAQRGLKAGVGIAQTKNRLDQIEEAKRRQKQIDDFNKKAKELQAVASTLPPEEQKKLIADLENNAIRISELDTDSDEGKSEYASIMTNLDTTQLQVENLAVFKNDLLKSIKTEESDGGLTNRWKSTDQALEYIGIIDGSTESQYMDGDWKFLLSSKEKEKENYDKIKELNDQLNALDESFEFGVIVDDEEYFNKQLEIKNQIEEVQIDINNSSKDWLSKFDMQEVIDENSFDKSINNTISEVAKTSLEAGQNGESLESIPNLNDIAINIVKEGNLTSLTLDSHIKGLDENNEPRNFKQDLYTSIFLGPDGSGTKWEDLGLDAETINALDQDPSTGTDDDKSKVSAQDALAIAEAILDDKNLSIDYLTDYLYNYFKQNWEKGNAEYAAASDYNPNEGL